jgi:hypothetical protein
MDRPGPLVTARSGVGSPGGSQDGEPGGMRDLADLGEITPEVLRKTFPGWRIFHDSGAWWATRGRTEEQAGPQSLLRRTLSAPDLPALAEKLCLQEWLDRLGEDELAAVYREVRLPEVSG